MLIERDRPWLAITHIKLLKNSADPTPLSGCSKRMCCWLPPVKHRGLSQVFSLWRRHSHSSGAARLLLGNGDGLHPRCLTLPNACSCKKTGWGSGSVWLFRTRGSGAEDEVWAVGSVGLNSNPGSIPPMAVWPSISYSPCPNSSI